MPHTRVGGARGVGRYLGNMEVASHGTEEHLAREIKRLQWRHHRELDRRMRAIGSTIVQWDVLRALSVDPNASGHDLALATFQSDQSLGQMIRRMEARGLITRSNPQGRRWLHQITPSGAEILAAGHSFAAEIFEQSFGKLSHEQRQQLAELLTVLNATED